MKLLKSAIKLLVVGLGGIIIIAVVIDSYSNPIQQQINESKSHTKEKILSQENTSIDNEQSKIDSWIYLSKENVKGKMKNPTDVMFRNVFFHRNNKENIPVVCGEVNGRNSFNAYTGYQKFIAAGNTLAFLEEEVDGFNSVWNDYCL